MTSAVLSSSLVLSGLSAALLLAPPRPAELVEFARRAVRPALLPFQWHALDEAQRHSDTAEAFARAQNVLRLLPEWADGHAVFAYRFALADSDAGADPAERAQRARARLELALAWMEAARPRAGKHEPMLLQMLAFLPEVAVRQEPALGAMLPPGGAAAIADRYLDEAERLWPTTAMRERRTFYMVRLAAGLLAAGNRREADTVLATAITRSHAVEDKAAATPWRANLEVVRRWLAGDRTMDLQTVRDDPRLQPLLPYLR
jgi:hypothetical protein